MAKTIFPMAASIRASSNVSDYPDIHKKPWKYIGYRGFASFVASDNDFFIFRRFSNLTARVLLALQDEISELEEQLVIIDARLSDPHAPDIHNGAFRQETSKPRVELLREIETKLKAYSKYSFYCMKCRVLILRRQARTSTHQTSNPSEGT